MVGKLKIVLILVLALALLGGGCANIKDDGTRTKTEGTLVGAGAGAAIGAGIGAIVGGGRGAAIGAGIGGLLGGITGFFVGKHIADKKSEYASEEDWLNDCVAQAREVNDEAVKYNAKLRTDIASLDAKSKKLAAAYKKNQASAESLKEEQIAVEKRQAEIKETIAGLESEVKSQKTVLADAQENKKDEHAKSLNQEIAKLEKQIAEMKAYNNKLASISARVAV